MKQFLKFLFRLIIAIYVVIACPIYIMSVLAYWVFLAISVITIIPLSWIIAGDNGVEFIKQYIDLNTYRWMLWKETDREADLTPMWFFYILDKLSNIHKSII